ncbi:hypothetical protein B0H14DRAFT_2807861, partial [Mycena olivaceomarginata]
PLQRRRRQGKTGHLLAWNVIQCAWAFTYVNIDVARNFKVARHTYAQQDVGVQSPCSQRRESLADLATAGNLTKVCGPE